MLICYMLPFNVSKTENLNMQIKNSHNFNLQDNYLMNKNFNDKTLKFNDSTKRKRH